MTSSSAGAGGDSDWCLIESDPAIFTEMLEQLGCKTVEFQELYSLEDEALLELQSTTNAVYGLIFLFEWKADTQKLHAETKQPVSEQDTPPNLFFAHQVTTNACATQAVLSVLFNAASNGNGDTDSNSNNKLSEAELGKVLSDFHSFTAEFPPQLKGVAVSSSEEIKAAHNSFSAADSFLHEGKQYDRDERSSEAFHFVAYVPVAGQVYELDGLQTGPIVAGAIENENNNNNNWLQTARTAIQDRMRAIGADAGAVKFNLMAVIQDKRVKLNQELQVAVSSATADSVDNSNSNSSSSMAQEALELEERKRAQWKLENQRRRHNYVPLAVQLLKELAGTGQLTPLVEAAKEKQAAKRRVQQLKNQQQRSASS